MSLSLTYLNTCSAAEFTASLDGIYEHSPWVVQQAAVRRPFATLSALKLGLQAAVRAAPEEQQLGLIRAHPELAGKAAIAGVLTVQSNGEQAQAGLLHCTPDEFATLQKLNADYNARFGFPFILAVKGPDGKGLTRRAIIDTFSRRLSHRRSDEIAECLRQIGRIAELRLNAAFGRTPHIGMTLLERCDILAGWSDDSSGLTCAYLTDAHRNTAAQLAEWMRDAGMQVCIDAVGNVVGRYVADDPAASTLMTGSHYDTVRNGGKYDGRFGILLALAAVEQLAARGEKLPYHLEVVGFAEEEGVRFKSTFLGSSAIAGRFDGALLQQCDAAGTSMLQALQAAGHDMHAIASITRKPEDVLGFVEVHIEQGPVLLDNDLPVGIVTSINGSTRYLINLTGIASHAGTTPMTMRCDAAAAAAEIVLFVEQRCKQAATLVGTVGQLQVPNGSINVVPGACILSLDVRAADDALRDAAVQDILQHIDAVCRRRGVQPVLECLLTIPAVPCASWLANQLGAAVQRSGVTPFALPSGAGHDAMMMANITSMAMLFTRCGNGGISHNPLETMTADDAELSMEILLDFLQRFQPCTGTRS
jgi:beta-ureidopropionase / N-carbamoyl-L-amino-acid hydrolase